MEYLSGGDLLSYIHRNFISIESIRIAIAEICLALEYLHQKGIIYRDLKPENIMISYDGHIKLTDFGLAKKIETNKCNPMCGTLNYIPPEMIRRNEYSFEVDWWQLGILTFELIFERCPFTGNTKEDIFRNICLKEPIFPFDADPKVVNFIKKLLVKDQKCRANFKLLKDHTFWKGINFDNILHKKIDPPFYPYVDDIENFESNFTKQKPTFSLSEPIQQIDDCFKNFPSIQNIY